MNLSIAYATFPPGKRMKEKQYVTVQSCCLMHYWKEPSYCCEQTSLKPLRNRIGCFTQKNEGKACVKSGFVFGFYFLFGERDWGIFLV